MRVDVYSISVDWPTCERFLFVWRAGQLDNSLVKEGLNDAWGQSFVNRFGLGRPALLLPVFNGAYTRKSGSLWRPDFDVFDAASISCGGAFWSSMQRKLWTQGSLQVCEALSHPAMFIKTWTIVYRITVVLGSNYLSLQICKLSISRKRY